MRNWLDLSTQQWVRLSGRRVDLPYEPWLQGPVGATDAIDDRWLGAEATRLRAVVEVDGKQASALTAHCC